jgi:hypothetical protein
LKPNEGDEKVVDAIHEICPIQYLGGTPSLETSLDPWTVCLAGRHALTILRVEAVRLERLGTDFRYDIAFPSATETAFAISQTP